MNTKATLPASMLLAVLVPAAAQAQAPVGTTSGFPIGEKSRIHTTFETGVGFDSNRDRFDDDPDGTRDDGQLSDWRAIFRPGLEIDVPGSSFRLNLRSMLTITQFFGTGQTTADTSYGGSIGLSTQLGSEQSIVSFKLENELVRTPTLFDESGTIASDERRFRQWFNDGSARLTLRPGGRALELDLGYRNRLSLYDADGDDGLPQGQQHGGIFEARWRFLPKTVLLFHGDVSTYIVGNDSSNPLFRTSEGLPIHVYVGAIGQVTSRLQAELTAGYGDTLTEDSNRGVRGPIGSAILKYAVTESINISGGYRRTIEPTVVLSAYSSDAAFLQFQSIFFGRLLFSAFGQYELRSFADLPGVGGLSNGSSANLVIADARTEYWFFEWLRASLSYRLLVQLVDEEDRVPPSLDGEPNVPGLQQFNRHQVLFNLGVRY